MISDRDYMRDDDGFRGLSWTIWLLIALVVVFALEAVAKVYLGVLLDRYGALSDQVWRAGWIWQLVTFQFLHGSFTHLFFNGLGLWMFGRPIEAAFGGRRMLTLWLAGGLVGGLLQLGVGAAFPQPFSTSVVGASAGLMTFLAIFCRLEPDARILLALIVPVPARFLFYLSLGVALFFTAVPPQDGVAHAAHLGGLLYGWLWVASGGHRGEGPWRQWTDRWEAWLAERRRRRIRPDRSPSREVSPARASASGGAAPRTKVGSSGSSGDSGADPAPRGGRPDADFIAREVDPILDKIAREGIASLTPAERQTLEAARSKVARR